MLLGLDLGRGEFVYGARDSVAGAVGLHGIHFVVVGGVGLQAVYTDAEDGLCVALIQADVGFRGLAQVRRSLAIVHYAEVFVRAAGVVADPANDHFVGLRGFDLGALTDFSVAYVPVARALMCKQARASRCQRCEAPRANLDLSSGFRALVLRGPRLLLPALRPLS